MKYEPKPNEVLTKSVKLNEKDNGSIFFSANIGDVERLIALIEEKAGERGVRFGFNIVHREGKNFYSAQMYVDEIPEPQQPIRGGGRGTYNNKSAAGELKRLGRVVA